MYIVIITGTPVILIMFLVLGFSAAYHAYLLLQGILAIIATVLLVAVSVGAAVLMGLKAKQCISPTRPKAPTLVLFMYPNFLSCVWRFYPDFPCIFIGGTHLTPT